MKKAWVSSVRLRVGHSSTGGMTVFGRIPASAQAHVNCAIVAVPRSPGCVDFSNSEAASKAGM